MRPTVLRLLAVGCLLFGLFSRSGAQPTAGPLVATGDDSSGTWRGFVRRDFKFEDRSATIVVPDQALPGRPWIWRGEFFGAFADADVELVKRGFHLAYLSIKDSFGSPEAVAAWDRFHAYVCREWTLAEKPALIGLSRGGLYCFNWAIANPTKVACIYADAPVCDFKSWPGGAPKGWGAGRGSPREWEKLLRAFSFADDTAAIAWKGNPVDNLAPLAAERVPLLLVYGDADDVVPWSENGAVLAARYQALGGRVEIIAKPGVGHHPHGLADPSPIVGFILRHTLTSSGDSTRTTPR